MNRSSREPFRYRTPVGLTVERTTEQLEAAGDASMRALAAQLDTQRGLLLASSFEYPGRYRRHALGFCAPPLVLESRARTFRLRALNPRGELLLTALTPALADARDLVLQRVERTELVGSVPEADAPESEEARTKRATLFSLVRAIRQALAHEQEPLLGLYGALGYDLVFQLESLVHRQPRSETRELVLYLPDEIYQRDPTSGLTERHRYEFELGSESTRERPRSAQLASYTARAIAAGGDHEPGQFVREVERARAAFASGDLFEVTLSQTFQRPFEGSPSALFQTLSTDNPAPYGFLANLGAGEFLIGASPEMFVRVTGTRVETCPIAGTIARGGDALGDAVQIRSLLNSEKEEAELTMCTDVDRNDKARICRPGSVRVLGRRQIELYARLIHTVDHVEGELREGYDGLDALLTHMWAVTVTGAPKLDAMQFIEDHEASPRRYYAGAIGALRFDGSVDTGLTLRTIHLRDGLAEVRAGATLLHDSEPEAEEREAQLKASALLAVLEPRREARAAQPRVARAALPVLLIDHRDSFVHTLADYFRQAGCLVSTVRHGFEQDVYRKLAPGLVVLSPGPKRPRDFALNETLAQLAARELPVFGVCLGLQGMVEFAGGALAQLATPVHGKASSVRVEGPLFAGLPSTLTVGRYHSLHAERASFPRDLTVLAETEDRCIMALAHRALPWHAVQFHPESILSARSAHGLQLIENVVALARR